MIPRGTHPSLSSQGDLLGTTTEHGSTASSMLSLITAGAAGKGSTGSRPTTVRCP